MAGAARNRVPALPQVPAEAAAGRFGVAAAGRFAEIAAGRFAEATAGRFAEASAGRFAEASARRFPFPRADGSSSPTGCTMLHDITTKQKVWSKNQEIEVQCLVAK